MVLALPDRPLEERANGIYDPVRKMLYRFRLGYDALPTKGGICYYIHSVTVFGANMGDAGPSVLSVKAVVGGLNSEIVYVLVPATTALAGDMATGSMTVYPHLLTDPKTLVDWSGTAALQRCIITYAEIPVDTVSEGF